MTLRQDQSVEFGVNAFTKRTHVSQFPLIPKPKF